MSREIDALKTSDTGEEAIAIMNVYHVRHLPIVNHETLLGTISENDIIQHELSEDVGSYALSMMNAYSKDTDHLFEVMRKMAEYELTVIPVIDATEKFLGCISLESIMLYFSKSFSFEEPGSILVLETDRANYSMFEISRIVEEESAAILASFLSFEEQSSRVIVTLKINKKDISRITASFIRYDYTIRGAFSDFEVDDSLQERYDSLMHYLNV